MIVCMSRRICCELYEAIRKLRPDLHHKDDDNGVMKILMTVSASGSLAWQDHIRNRPRCRSTTRAAFDSLAVPLSRASPNALRCPSQWPHLAPSVPN